MTLRTALALSLAAASLAFAGCGIILAPFTLAEAVNSNANYSFKGDLIDTAGQPVDGVVYTERSYRRFWALLEGTVYKSTDLVKRADRSFNIEVRGSDLTVEFSKEGYRSVEFRFDASNNKEVATNGGKWPTNQNFAVMLIPINVRDAYLAHDKFNIRYDHYPIADIISLPNLLSDGKTGDILYQDKDASDPTVIPDGTFFLTLDTAPPKAINAAGLIDPAELDIPNAVTVKIAGPDSGLIRMAPQNGLHPMLVSSLAPENGYAPEIVLDRNRLKQMRTASHDNIPLTAEYFFFRAGNRFGKGVLSWANSSGKPEFTIELFIQKRQDTRDLTTFDYLGK